MKGVFVIGVCCLISLALGDQVLELGDKDFDQLTNHEVALVMFYAPWCGHCKKLKPEFSKAAAELSANVKEVKLVKVDCTEAGKETCNTYGVQGYPTLKVFRQGEFSKDYTGSRDAAGIIKYMKSQVGPSTVELKSVEAVNEFEEKETGGFVMGFFKTDSNLKGEYIKLANKLREQFRFGISSYSDVLEHYGHEDAVVLFRPRHLANKFEDSQVLYEGEPSAKKIEEFLSDNYHGLVGHRVSENKHEFKHPLVIAYYSVDYVKNPKGTNYWRNRVLKVAKNYQGKNVNFAVSSKDHFQHELNEFGVDFLQGDKPAIFAYGKDKKKFVMKDEFSIEALETFVDNLLADKLEPYLKSEEIPKDNDGPVGIVVAKNFQEVVMDSDKDILIEFYAPWCGHCRQLTPIYEEVGKAMKGEDVLVLKMDATANDVSAPFTVKGFPTIYWLPKDTKSPTPYDGAREKDDFIKFIAAHATSELNKYDRNGKEKKTEL